MQLLFWILCIISIQWQKFDRMVSFIYSLIPKLGYFTPKIISTIFVNFCLQNTISTIKSIPYFFYNLFQVISNISLSFGSRAFSKGVVLEKLPQQPFFLSHQPFWSGKKGAKVPHLKYLRWPYFSNNLLCFTLVFKNIKCFFAPLVH